jgi:hypothetical protein
MLSSACWEKNEKGKEKRNSRGFFPGLEPGRFLWLLGAIKG